HADGSIKLWDGETGAHIRDFREHDKYVFTLAFHPKEPWLVSGGRDGVARLWDLTNGSVRRRFPRQLEEIHCVALSSDGRFLATALNSAIRIYDVTTGTETATLRGHVRKVASVAWSPNGRRLVSASDDKTIKIWDPIGGIEILTLIGHRG